MNLSEVKRVQRQRVSLASLSSSNEKSPGILIICRKGARHQIFAFFIMFVLFSNSENLLSCQKKASYLFEEVLRQIICSRTLFEL